MGEIGNPQRITIRPEPIKVQPIQMPDWLNPNVKPVKEPVKEPVPA